MSKSSRVMVCSGMLLVLAACGDKQSSGGALGVAGRANADHGATPSAGAASLAGTNSVAGSGANAGNSGVLAAAGSSGGRAAAGASGSHAADGGGGAGSGGGGGAAGVAGSSAGSAATPGAGGTAGTGGSSAAAPSAGCMKATGRPANGTVMMTDRIYSFPTAYDGKTPLPLLLGLHAAGNPNTQIQNLTKGSKLETDYVRIFPKSAGSAWVYDTDIAKVKAAIDDVSANYCIDTSRMFATGHSSGAQMAVQMLCNGETRFKAVAPVAASKYCNKVSPVPVMYIQGMMDAQRGGGNGMDVVNLFTTSNACTSMTMPKPDVAACTSSFDHMQVTPGCVTYQGCKAPTIWCSHNDNGYNNTDGRQHGWPCFASSAIAEFFAGLP
jgi:polyhydroxybutyrate depolymerase